MLMRNYVSRVGQGRRVLDEPFPALEPSSKVTTDFSLQRDWLFALF
jgi:hypothetical protein